MPGPIVCFGELLVRLAAPDSELLLQTPRLDVAFAGAEANVAVSLARFGHPAKVLSVVADNALGLAAIDALRRYGVDTSAVRTGPGRMGLYFLTPGAGQRASQVLYDRADSAFVRGAPGLDWARELKGASRLHVSGVTPALGADLAEAVIAAAETARGMGITVSADGNYRGSLWAAWNGDAPALLRRLLATADIAFADHRDIGLVLGEPFEGEGMAVRQAAATRAFEAFPNLERMACTERIQHSVNNHDLTALLFTRAGAWKSRTRSLDPIVDRIGGGDAFAAGILHGLITGMSEDRTVEFAVAAAALKHATPGDFNLAYVADVEALMGGTGLDVRR